MSTGESLVEEFPPSVEGQSMADFPFLERTGLDLLLAERGRVVIRLPFEPNVNHVGMVYAGALFTLAEVPGGVLFFAAFDGRRFYPIVGELSIRFQRPVSTSVLVDARMTEAEMARVGADLEENGRAKWVLEQRLVDEAGAVVATTSGTYFALSR